MKKFTTNEKVAVGVSLVVAGIMFVFLAPNLIGNIFMGKNNQASLEESRPTDTSKLLKIQDTEIGAGVEARAGDMVSVKYTGKLLDGSVFDSSDAHGGEPIKFKLGSEQVIKGWDIGLLGMKVGGKRALLIAPELGYGERAIGPIPANSTLYFEVELVGVNLAE